MLLSKRNIAVGSAAVLFVASAVFVLKHFSHPPSDPFAEELKERVPGAAVPVEAVEFLGEEGERGKLPGIVKGDHVAFALPASSVETNGVFRSDFTGTVSYPLSVTVDADKNGEGFLYHYSIERTSKRSPWHLRRAWRTDNAGQVKEDYPLQ